MRCPACNKEEGHALWVCAVEPTPEMLAEGKPLSPGWVRSLVCADCGTMRLARDDEDHKIWMISAKEDRAVGQSEVASTPPLDLKIVDQSTAAKEKGNSGGDQTV